MVKARLRNRLAMMAWEIISVAFLIVMMMIIGTSMIEGVRLFDALYQSWLS